MAGEGSLWQICVTTKYINDCSRQRRTPHFWTKIIIRKHFITFIIWCLLFSNILTSSTQNMLCVSNHSRVRATQICILVFIFGWLWLSLWGNHFEETIETHTDWRKVKQIQLMLLCSVDSPPKWPNTLMTSSAPILCWHCYNKLFIIYKHFLGSFQVRGGRLSSVHIHIEDNLCAFMC